jgi:pyrimidine deaminase RibD-like protein
MTDRELMEQAIAELEKCTPADPEQIPKVGAVIAIDGKVIASTHRGEHDHAEKRALEQIDPARDLSEATVYTTLEPCTRRVRRKEGESCTDRLVRKQVKKVMIGILDPNQGVCGKGVLELQAAKIEVELFPHDLAQRIRQLNDKFIQAQQSLGIRITAPENGALFRGTNCRVRGTFRNPPRDNVIAITYVGGQWWPQLSPVRIIPERDNEWEVDVNFGIALPHKIYLVKASELGMEMITYFRKMVLERNQAIMRTANHFHVDPEEARLVIAPLYWSLSMATLPKGLDMEAWIEINVTSLESDVRRRPRQLGTLKGTVQHMAPDFDAPLEDFKEYME